MELFAVLGLCFAFVIVSLIISFIVVRFIPDDD